MASEDAWENDVTGEGDEDDIQDETPLPDIDKQFKDNVLQVKHSLYENIVLAPTLETPAAQDNMVLDHYVDQVNKVYLLSLNAQKRLKIKDASLNEFPAASRDIIRQTLQWITNFFANNTIAKTVPYEDFIHSRLHVYPFVQK